MGKKKKKKPISKLKMIKNSVKLQSIRINSTEYSHFHWTSAKKKKKLDKKVTSV